ncbi:hypothetical protein Trydic_g15505 [Trypoxylus dichotomus]
MERDSQRTSSETATTDVKTELSSECCLTHSIGFVAVGYPFGNIWNRRGGVVHGKVLRTEKRISNGYAKRLALSSGGVTDLI